MPFESYRIARSYIFKLQVNLLAVNLLVSAKFAGKKVDSLP